MATPGGRAGGQGGKKKKKQKKLANGAFQLRMHGVIHRGIVANTSAPGSSLSVLEVPSFLVRTRA